ncbi:multidrug effflux MFS transporter [Ammonicoccus fulvus]|uniref:Multidrug effflux MFS transporter n=1 Tax=Ammonicoccus fulvus TaxID=3138240 RepID=A0ABZ3FQR4_9ACTN
MNRRRAATVIDQTPAPKGSRRTRAITLGAALMAPLIIISAMPPLGTSAYLPGLPAATESLNTSTATAQLTLTLYIVGLAVGQLVIGPLSDRIGRRPPLLLSIVAFVALTVGVALSPTITVMLIFRFLQGIAASAGMVLGRAIVHDIATGDRAARAMSTIMAAGLVVPALAPLLGAVVLAFADWRMIFLVLAGLGALVGVWVTFAIPETHPRRRGVPDAAPAGRGRPQRPHHPSMPRFIFATLVVSLAFASMYAYVSASPFVFQQIYGFTPTGYALTGAGLAFVMATVGILGTRLLGYRTPLGVLTPDLAVISGLTVLVIGSALVLIVVLSGAPVAWLIAALALAVSPLAIIFGSATSIAMDASPLPGGTASAILGTTQALFGAATPPLVGILGPDARPMAFALAIAAALALGASVLANRSAPAAVREA